MKISNLFNISLFNIKNNKMRSILTMLGLVVGISSVIVLVGIASGASSDVNNQVAGLGTNILTLKISDSDYSFKYEDLDSLLDINNVDSYSPYKSVSSSVSRNNTTSSNTSIIASDQNYLDVTGYKLSSGRKISIIDIENKSKVCIIGSDTAETFFSLADPLGETIKIDGDKYTVIGVLEESGGTIGSNIDSAVIIPLTTANYLGVDTSINNIYIKVNDESIIDYTISNIENFVRQTLQISTDYFSVTSQSSILDAMEEINDTFVILLGGIASISLIVGGIGVMNVMLVSVSERTKEIGIRKSLGAKRIDILLQFLIEALILCLLGGLFGIIFGLIIGYASTIFDFTFTYSNNVILLSVTVSLLIGLFFGIFPAYKASSLNPIDALRSE